MERVPREKTPETLAEIFFDLVCKGSDSIKSIDIAGVYYHLFSMMPQKELQSNLEFIYECYMGTMGDNKDDRKWYKENWFYSFHKSLRQSDFYQTATVEYHDPLTTEAEEKERKKLIAKYDKVRERIPEDRNLKPTEQVALWRNAWNADYPEESKRLIELNKKRQNTVKFTISGHIAMTLWGVIQLDHEAFLMMTMERTFNEYQLRQKYGRKQEQPAGSGA